MTLSEVVNLDARQRAVELMKLNAKRQAKQKWPRKSAQRHKWKLRASCWAVTGLARRSI